MKNLEIFDLLTTEYYLKLVTTQQDIVFLKEIRQKVLLPAYEKHTHIEDIDKFLYNQDDEQSFIYILIHNTTQKPVGTIRVFFINNKTPIKQLPIQMYGGVSDIDNYMQTYPVCEISRLALIKDLPPYPKLSALKHRTILTIGLQSAIAINMYLYGYTTVFSIMEPALYRLLSRYGIDFKPIGQEVDYFGPRIPHAIPRDKLMREADKTLWEIALFYLKELAQNPDAFIEYINNHPYLTIDNIYIDKLIDTINKHPDISVDKLLELS